MEHLHERDTPALAQLETGHAGEPVVRVNHVVVYPFGPAVRLDTLDELRQIRVDGMALERRLWSRGEMDDARALAEIGHPGDRRVLGAREDVHIHAHAAELSRRLAHVHVHPARLLAPEGGEGAGVDAEDGDAQAHGRTLTRKRSCGVGPKAYL